MNMISPVADADALCRKARQFLDAGRPGAARPLVAAARALNAAPIELALLQASLALVDATSDQALTILDAAIEMFPMDIRLLNARASIRQTAGDWAGAATDAADAITYEPSNSEAKARLGAALLELGFVAEATVCLGEALAAAPTLAFCREALARSLEVLGEIDGALRVLIDGIQIKPVRSSLVNAAIKLTLRLRDFSSAVKTGQQARTCGVANAETFVLLGHAFECLECFEDAQQAYQEAVKLAPEDPTIRLFAASLPQAGVFRQATDLRQMFDNYAAHFDDSAKRKSYAVPGLMAAVVARHPTLMAMQHLDSVLDLGCGTGLVATALSALPIGPVTGVDISPAMLTRAQGTSRYAALHCSDAIAFLTKSPCKWSLITAADVVPYTSDVTELLRAVRLRLTPDGWFVFSIEMLKPSYSGSLPSNGYWAPQWQARYAHSEEYVLNNLIDSGFCIIRQDRCMLRKEFDAGVPGLLLTVGLQKA